MARESHTEQCVGRARDRRNRLAPVFCYKNVTNIGIILAPVNSAPELEAAPQSQASSPTQDRSEGSEQVGENRVPSGKGLILGYQRLSPLSEGIPFTEMPPIMLVGPLHSSAQTNPQILAI
jgi:hypothetical protein